MPIFDYRCRSCGADFELLVRSASVPTCPRCGSQALDRQVSAPAAPGKSQGIIASARKAAAKEGHFSNYSRAERGKLPK